MEEGGGKAKHNPSAASLACSSEGRGLEKSFRLWNGGRRANRFPKGKTAGRSEEEEPPPAHTHTPPAPRAPQDAKWG